MVIHPSNLLFYNLSNEEAVELERVADAVVAGTSGWRDEPILQKWLDAGGFDSNQAFLVCATLFPARAFKSLTNFYACKGKI